MYRRRRPRSSEIAFSFDSFLDLVCNVVGVILRLILVAWVGARAYTGYFKPPETPGEPDDVAVAADATVPTTEAEKAALADANRRLAAARAALLEQLRRHEDLQSRRQDVQRQTTLLTTRADALKRQADAVEKEAGRAARECGQVELSLADVDRRCEAIEKELAELKKQPVHPNILHYQTPLARTFQSEELQFEIQDGRVCFLDVDALVREIKQGMRSKEEQLKTHWEVVDETSAVGAFKLRYRIARERGLIDSVTGTGVPDERSEFRYGLDRWEAVPLMARRGETVEEALAEGSQFRRIIDHLDPTQTAVTFWVYPESFAAYRQLRDHCLRRDLLVAGRPLPEGVPIASSRTGSASRGQ